MVRQIVLISVGEAASKYANSYWSHLADEHNLLPDFVTCRSTNLRDFTPGKYYNLCRSDHVTFDETKDGHYTPRSVMIAPAQVLSHRYDSTQIVSLGCDSSAAFGEMFETSVKSKPKISNAVRIALEKCDEIDCIQVVSDASESAGSVLGPAVLNCIADQHDGIFTQSVCFIDTPHKGDYYRYYSLNHSLAGVYRKSDHVLIGDLNVVRRSARTVFGTKKNTHGVIANTLAAISSSLRFNTASSFTSMRGMYNSLVPVPSLRVSEIGAFAVQPHTQKSRSNGKYLKRASRAILGEDSPSQMIASLGLARGTHSVANYDRQLTSNRHPVTLTHDGAVALQFESSVTTLHTTAGLSDIVDAIHAWACKGITHNHGLDNVISNGFSIDDLIDDVNTSVDIAHHFESHRGQDDPEEEPRILRQHPPSESVRLPVIPDTKLLVVLDIDDTLIHVTRVKHNTPELGRFSFSADSKRWVASPRPGLIPFIDHLIADPRICIGVWTAATRRYGECVLLHFLGRSRMENLLCFYHRQHFKDHRGVKFLSAIADEVGIPLQRVVMVDDSRSAFNTTDAKSNVIFVKPYCRPHMQRTDKELERVAREIEHRVGKLDA